jgi:hypothetical protein
VNNRSNSEVSKFSLQEYVAIVHLDYCEFLAPFHAYSRSYLPLLSPYAFLMQYLGSSSRVEASLYFSLSSTACLWHPLVKQLSFSVDHLSLTLPSATYLRLPASHRSDILQSLIAPPGDFPGARTSLQTIESNQGTNWDEQENRHIL